MIYFDNAATTFPKPPYVSEEVYRCIRSYGGNPGRSGHSLSLKAAEKVYECRELASDMFGLGDPTRVVFTHNTTEALNVAIKGLLHVGDHVIISDMEHNAVLRPIKKLSALGLIEYSVYRSGSEGEQSQDSTVENIRSLIRPNTGLIVSVHASNICSAVMPIQAIGELCRETGISFIVDAAASAGHIPINMTQMNINALCVPGHKGLYGPQGSGMLLLDKSTFPETSFEGGNGINSLDGDMSDILPERYEAGTLPTPAIAGLCEGIKAVQRSGIGHISRLEGALYSELLERLKNMKGITVYAPSHIGHTLLFNVDGIPSDMVGSELNRSGICVRSGYHCAPLAHSTLKTPDGGAVRVSFGMYNTKSEVAAFCDEIYKYTKYRKN